MVETHELSNTLLDAASLAFGRALDDSLLVPFVDRYFERAMHMWSNNTFKIAEYLMENLYPMPLANQALATETAKWIDNEEIVAIPALRRILVENLANVERAIKAQERDLKG